MGAVFLAEHLYLDRKVALKVLSEDLADDEGFRKRFLRESRLAERLSDHPNVIRVYDAGEADSVLYLAMRYVDGTDLRRVLKRERPLPIERTISIITQVASALDAAHGLGLVHRDVKPANILMEAEDGGDHCFLADFGIVREMQSRTRLTMTGYMLGTPDYMAPEQISGRGHPGQGLDGRADVYSLGCVLFECLTGRPPYVGSGSVEEALDAHLKQVPPRVTDLRPDLSPATDNVLHRAMAKSRDDRYPTCGLLAADATEALRTDTRQWSRGDAPTVVVPKPPAFPGLAETEVEQPRRVGGNAPELQIPSIRGVEFDFAGEELLFGYSERRGYYGIWERNRRSPLLKFPATEEGREQGYAEFCRLEPDHVELG